MKHTFALLTGLLLVVVGTLTTHGATVTLFTEGFENPALPPNTTVGIPTGMVNLENSGWEIVNNDPLFGVGIFLTNEGELAASANQVLGIGGGDSTGSSASILISGFSGVFLPSIEFDHYSTALFNQATTVTVTDPGNADNILFTSTVFGNGFLNADFDSSPVGDLVELTIGQAGNSTDSDTAVDNITISAPMIPEPSRALLTLLGLGVVLLGRRR